MSLINSSEKRTILRRIAVLIVVIVSFTRCHVTNYDNKQTPQERFIAAMIDASRVLKDADLA